MDVDFSGLRLGVGLGVIFVGAGLVACAPPTSVAGLTEQAITQSTPDDGDPNVVAIARDTNLFCTGTLITPRVVVTAGHCVSQGVRVYFGNDPTQGGEYINVLDIRTHPLFDRSGLINDVGLALLEHESSVEPKALWTRPFDQSVIDRQLRLVGFGKTGSADHGPPIKRQGLSTISDYTDLKFLFHPNPSQTCEGDSGGPAFMTGENGDELLIGITTSGDPACTMLAHDTRVDPYVADFIRPYLDATAVGGATTGGVCFYDANCDTGECRAADDSPALHYCTRSCVSAADCPSGMDCTPGAQGGLRCHYPAPTPGMANTRCGTAIDCLSNLCARVTDSPFSGTCVTQCTDNTQCAPGSVCQALHDPAISACVPATPPPSCSMAPGSRRGPFVLGLAALLGLWASRRRRSRVRSR